MIDTHAHLDFPDFDEDREEVIRRAFDSGVKRIINIGVDLATSRKSIEIAENHEGVFASVGIHPEYFIKHETHNMEQLSENLKVLAKNKKVVAIGEIGLDYYSHTSELITDIQKENQKKGFVAQIKLARELELPVVVHSRDAWNDLYEIIFNHHHSRFILHCYSGEKKDTEKFLEFPNVSFSFSGNITYPKPAGRAEKLAEAVRMIPLDRIMLDSDSPFLAPQAVRGKKNEPANIRYISEKIAKIKEISGEKVERVTDLNAIKFFGI